jgi:hypothetical protein
MDFSDHPWGLTIRNPGRRVEIEGSLDEKLEILNVNSIQSSVCISVVVQLTVQLGKILQSPQRKNHSIHPTNCMILILSN